MILVIDRVLDEHETAAVFEAAAALDFEDGRKTAGRHARARKHNEQAVDNAARDAVLEKVRTRLLDNELVQSAARPRRFARMAVSRYTTGMTYGFHTDDAIMDGSRTDLSFTLCLSPASAYEGGELVIDDPLEQRAIRLDAGQMVLYPSNTLHRVAPVTSGERLAVIGWITSWVADPARRATLFDLDRAARELHAAVGDDGPGMAELLRARSNLLRMWADG
jgi:PKHD-type hydroxylase